MAKIAMTEHQAAVSAKGAARKATVNFSGALMEMLATVYVYILMAAIREAVQNGCDAARRAGLSFAEGVMMTLPSASNPMVTVVDRGAGMTHEFMESTYLSFGSSTKAGDDDAAGGLGVGRWAAYGYIRECYIATCAQDPELVTYVRELYAALKPMAPDALVEAFGREWPAGEVLAFLEPVKDCELIERTYFQFQGADATPEVQLAMLAPATATGTRVYFPVKDSDVPEALRATAWLKGVMQLTMGDSFSVDAPGSLPDIMPKSSGVTLELGDFDPELVGVKVYPMQDGNLKYGRDGLQHGSLLVMANQAAGVGGLPFHVQSVQGAESVFWDGMVIEVPMSFKVPFMPSREEVKYTDEVSALMRRIDRAAALAVTERAKALYSVPDLTAKGELSNLLGNKEHWHWFARAARGGNGTLSESLRKVTGGTPWAGRIQIPVVSKMHTSGAQLRFTLGSEGVLRQVFPERGYLSMSAGPRGGSVYITFAANQPVTLVVNDLKSGGVARFRNWLPPTNRHFLYISAEKPGDAQEVADEVNAAFGGALDVMLTSKMPEVARVVVGTKVKRTTARGSALTYYSFGSSKQESELCGITTYMKAEPMRVWLGKNGGDLTGFKEGTTVATLTKQSWDASISSVMGELNVGRLYLLSPKQVEELTEAQATVKDEGLWDALPEDFGDDDAGREQYEVVQALKSWVPFEDAVARVVESQVVQDVLTGSTVRSVNEHWPLNTLCVQLAKKPRMELTGSKFDKALSPYIDTLTGDVRLKKAADIKKGLDGLCKGLHLVGSCLDVNPDDSEERKELVATLLHMKTVGHVEYSKHWEALTEKFPMLGTAERLNVVSDEGFDHFCRAMAMLYR